MTSSHLLFWIVYTALTGVLAFLIGSIPFGVIVGRFFYKTDLRRSGSGNIGAANALRSYGVLGGVLVLALDALKGFVAANLVWAYAAWLGPAAMLFGLYLGVSIDGEGATPEAFLGLLAVLGHCFSPWLRFKGGKGVATFLGMLFAQSWIVGTAFVAIWIAIVAPSRYASLGSIIASLLAPLTLWFVWHDGSASAVTALAALVIVWKHRENIVRLREARENKIGFGKAAT